MVESAADNQSKPRRREIAEDDSMRVIQKCQVLLAKLNVEHRQFAIDTLIHWRNLVQPRQNRLPFGQPEGTAVGESE